MGLSGPFILTDFSHSFTVSFTYFVVFLCFFCITSRSPRQHDALAAPRRFQPVLVAPPRAERAERPPLPPQPAVEVARTPNVPPLAQGPCTLVPGRLGKNMKKWWGDVEFGFYFGYAIVETEKLTSFV